MPKLLVNAPTGDQQLIKVGEGGGYFDDSRVLWDERKDGPLPEIILNGMAREEQGLVFSQALLDSYTANPPPKPQPAPTVSDVLQLLLTKKLLTQDEIDSLKR